MPYASLGHHFSEHQARNNLPPHTIDNHLGPDLLLENRISYGNRNEHLRQLYETSYQ
jgi:hypothetical protein